MASTAEPTAAAPEAAHAAFTTGQGHLEAALRRLDVLLRKQVLARRREPGAERFHELSGLVIRDGEIDALWSQAAAAETCTAEQSREVQDLEEVERRLGAQLAAGLAGARRSGIRLPLVELGERFDLTPFDLDALLVCLAPELDPASARRYEKTFAYLQDDVTRKRPSAGLVLELLCQGTEELRAARLRLAPEAPLLRHRLLAREAATPEPPFLAGTLRVEERIVRHLLAPRGGREETQGECLGESLAGVARWIPSPSPPAAGGLSGPFRKGLESLLAEERGRRGGPRLVLESRVEGDGREVAELLSARLRLPLLVSEAPRLLAAGVDGAGGTQALTGDLCREVRLRGAALCLTGAEALLSEGSGAGGEGRRVLEALDALPRAVMLVSGEPWPPQGVWCRVPLPRPTWSRREELWREEIAAQGLALDPETDLEAGVGAFVFGRERIRHAVTEAHRAGVLSGDGRAPLTAEALGRAARAQSRARLHHLARKVSPLYTWDDIVLEAQRLAQLQEVCAHVRHHRRVFERWGFDTKVARGRGVAVLLVGPSGGGKTMAAEIIAGELGLDLYKINLSTVVSKYIGETEKNLARVFREAEGSPVVLFFDEADSLFGKRSQVKDAHDRYANIEISYLLQRMEEHEGVVILASNFRKNLDEAFTRRLRFVIELPSPRKEQRRQLWERMFPPGVPRCEDLDLDFLAARLELTGGQIRNIVLAAAFLAAEEARPVAMEHLVRSAQRELAKTGRLCVKGDFGPYFHLLRGNGVREGEAA